MRNEYLLGIDLGTTGSKALLMRTDGTVAASATTPYPLSTPRPLWAEQDPADWWQATAASIQRALREAGARREAVLAVGLTGQMHGLVLLNGARRVLRPAILWNDQRTADECRSIEERVGKDRLLALTANLVLPGFTAPKILWVQRHDPESCLASRRSCSRRTSSESASPGCWPVMYRTPQGLRCSTSGEEPGRRRCLPPSRFPGDGCPTCSSRR
jgi:sugar (pentulose or hexulose) kinase